MLLWFVKLVYQHAEAADAYAFRRLSVLITINNRIAIYKNRDIPSLALQALYGSWIQGR